MRRSGKSILMARIDGRLARLSDAEAQDPSDASAGARTLRRFGPDVQDAFSTLIRTAFAGES
jgi:hypothetical protein